MRRSGRSGSRRGGRRSPPILHKASGTSAATASSSGAGGPGGGSPVSPSSKSHLPAVRRKRSNASGAEQPRSPREKSRFDPELAERVVSVLEKPPAERNDDDLDVVYRWLVVQRPDEDIGLFRLQSADLMREICREMVHVRLQGDSPDKRVLFTQGAEATRYYMVLRGAIAIYVRDREHQERVLAEERRRESEGIYDNYAAMVENLGKHIRTMGPGQGVGRQALGEAESGDATQPTERVRTASVVASPECERVDLIGLERSVYAHYVRAQEAFASGQVVQFLQQLHAFRHWPRSTLVRFALGGRHREFAEGALIARQGTDASELFIVEEGQAVETQRLWLDARTKKLMATAESAAPLHCLNVEVAVMGPFDLMGERAIMKGAMQHFTNLRARTAVQALVIPRTLFASYIAGPKATATHTRKTLSFLQDVELAREDWRRNCVDTALATPEHTIRTPPQLMHLCHGYCTRCGRAGHRAGDAKLCRIAIAERRTRQRRHRKYVFADTKGFVTGTGQLEERFGQMRPQRAAFRMPGPGQHTQRQRRPPEPVCPGKVPWPSFMPPQGASSANAGQEELWADTGAPLVASGTDAAATGRSSDPGAEGEEEGAGKTVERRQGPDVQDQVAELMVRRHGLFCARTHARLEEEAGNVPGPHTAPTPPAHSRALSARTPPPARVARAYAKGLVTPSDVRRRLVARAGEIGSAADYERAREEEVVHLGGERAMMR